MITECFPFIKYVYVGILFIFVFLALYSQHIQSIGYGSLFGLQTIFTLLTFFDISMDNTRSNKVLSMDIPASKYTKSYTINFAYWLVLIPCMALQFISSMLMVLTWSYLSKRDDTVPLSRSNEIKVTRFKAFSVIITILLLCLLYSYFMDFNGTTSLQFSEAYKIWITMIIIILLFLSIINVTYANEISKLRFQSTDG